MTVPQAITKIENKTTKTGLGKLSREIMTFITGTYREKKMG